MATQNYRKRGGLITIFMMIIWMLAILKFIPLSNMVSDQSIAVFSICFQFFMILFLVSGYAVPTFVTKWISLRVSRGQYKNAKQVFGASLIASLVLNIVLGVIFFFVSDVYACGIHRIYNIRKTVVRGYLFFYPKEYMDVKTHRLRVSNCSRK